MQCQRPARTNILGGRGRAGAASCSHSDAFGAAPAAGPGGGRAQAPRQCGGRALPVTPSRTQDCRSHGSDSDSDSEPKALQGHSSAPASESSRPGAPPATQRAGAYSPCPGPCRRRRRLLGVCPLRPCLSQARVSPRPLLSRRFLSSVCAPAHAFAPPPPPRPAPVVTSTQSDTPPHPHAGPAPSSSTSSIASRAAASRRASPSARRSHPESSTCPAPPAPPGLYTARPARPSQGPRASPSPRTHARLRGLRRRPLSPLSIANLLPPLPPPFRPARFVLALLAAAGPRPRPAAAPLFTGGRGGGAHRGEHTLFGSAPAARPAAAPARLPARAVAPAAGPAPSSAPAETDRDGVAVSDDDGDALAGRAHGGPAHGRSE